ncbi:formylmethanofuran dehydrogenase subunit E family protein [Acidicapsa dinghuensis]|uniref:Formylmethanofuran dehydrogenase subunit E family protein n=1 Tax=Acidicapsa dinghuensis TaxID=2218256 RepID=A0ABW1E9X0_9BACT|nr:formylmethanofuran dehydrogenase subunit E family protein [Acidicapsa dinghuensis]
MESFEDLLGMAEQAHGHMCAGQVLGVRMAMLGCRQLGVEDPRGADRKKLVTFVEIDRCATDAIGMVTNCKLGRRALKFRDWGKMAATFVHLESGKAIRIVALENSRELAAQRFPEIQEKSKQQLAAYRELSDAELFQEQWVTVELPPQEMPGYKGARMTCDECGEGVNFDRFVERVIPGGTTVRLCLSCSEPGLKYWRSRDQGPEARE